MTRTYIAMAAVAALLSCTSTPPVSHESAADRAGTENFVELLHLDIEGLNAAIANTLQKRLLASCESKGVRDAKGLLSDTELRKIGRCVENAREAQSLLRRHEIHNIRSQYPDIADAAEAEDLAHLLLPLPKLHHEHTQTDIRVTKLLQGKPALISQKTR